MTFEEDGGEDSVDLCNCKKADIYQEGVQEELKVLDACWSSIGVMFCCDAVKISHIGLTPLQNIICFTLRNFRNWLPRFTQLKDVGVIILDIVKSVGLLQGIINTF